MIRPLAIDRRAFVHRVAGGVGSTAAVLAASRASASTLGLTGRREPVRAVLFDAFPVFDPRPVAALAETEFPGRGAELTALWRTRQFEYTWLRTAARDYADFWRCTDDALRFAATSLHLDLDAARRERLMNAHLALRPWPDAAAALRSLRASGVRLGMLSNFTPTMLDTAIRDSGLDGIFEHVLSTDQARTYKPDPAAYQLGVDAFGLPREEIVFAAFASWDAAGAKRFGYPTYWVNRSQAPAEMLGTSPPDGTGLTLSEFAAYLAS
jgi:2-haloacid dehalogenase